MERVLVVVQGYDGDIFSDLVYGLDSSQEQVHSSPVAVTGR